MNYKEYFNNKKITVMGLGLLGRGVGDVEFLLSNGADLIVTDLKSENELEQSLDRLRTHPRFGDITFVLGQHRREDFRDRDYVLKSAGVPRDSEFIDEARKNNIKIVMSASWFAELANIKIIGVTGTRGKSTVTHLLHKIIKDSGQNVHLGGNIRGVSTLSLLEVVLPTDMAVLELDSWQLQGFGDAKISPHIAVFTSFLSDHMNYYKGNVQDYFDDKANIYKYQTADDFLVTTAEPYKMISKNLPASKLTVVEASEARGIPTSLIGAHNQMNIGLAISVARILGIQEKSIATSVEAFKAVEGRLQFVGEQSGVKIYNDNNSTTPDATIAGIKSFDKDCSVHLIAGGKDKDLNIDRLADIMKTHCRSVTLYSGSGTELLKISLEENKTKYSEFDNLESCFENAMSHAVSGDVVLFSPGFASFGSEFRNEYDRNDKFMKIVSDYVGK